MAKMKLTQREIIDAIAALSEAIKANKGHLLGDEDVIELSNAKLKELIPQIKPQKNNSMKIHQNQSEPWKVTLLDTGLNTMTGG